MAGFPPQRDGFFYLTEGGQETEIMYRHGHDLPEFAMYPLLDDAAAMADLTAMYEKVLDVAAEHGCGVMLTGLDYRASPDWGDKLGYSREALAEANLRSIDFLRRIVEPYRGRIPVILIGGVIGPRGDAYALNRVITADDAADYHGFQAEVLKRAGVDFIWGATYNNVPEAVGLCRAVAPHAIPLTISFTLTGDHRLRSGPSLKEAIEQVDAEAGEGRPDFYGINCSHPLEFEPALEPGGWIRRIRSLRPNASAMDKIALCKIGHLEDGDPEDLGRSIGDLARRFPHMDVFGGCCGTWAPHLDQMARQVAGAA